MKRTTELITEPSKMVVNFGSVTVTTQAGTDGATTCVVRIYLDTYGM